MRKKISNLGLAALSWLAILPNTVFASTNSRCEAFFSMFNVNRGNDSTNIFGSDAVKFCSLSGFIQWAINIASILAGITAVVFLIVGGYMYMTSGGAEEQAEQGRKTMTNSIIGLVVIILAYAIVRAVASLFSTGR